MHRVSFHHGPTHPLPHPQSTEHSQDGRAHTVHAVSAMNTHAHALIAPSLSPSRTSSHITDSIALQCPAINCTGRMQSAPKLHTSTDPPPPASQHTTTTTWQSCRRHAGHAAPGSAAAAMQALQPQAALPPRRFESLTRVHRRTSHGRAHAHRRQPAPCRCARSGSGC